MPPRKLVHRVGHKPIPSGAGGFGCCLLIRELPQVDAFAVLADGSAPLAPVRRPTNSSVFRGRVAVAGFVLPIAVQRDRPQVATPVVKAVPIDVVTFEPVATGESQQLAVQADVTGAAIGPLAAFGVPLVIHRPSPLTRPFHVSSINDGIGQDCIAAALKWDQGGQSIFALADGGSPPRSAGERTIKGFALLDTCGYGEEIAVARVANAGDGTLLGHRVTSGVSPRPSQAARGHLLPLNDTPYQIGGSI